VSDLNLDQLKQIMQRCSGVTEGVDISGDITDRPFREIGYDSLAVLEIASQLQRDFKMQIPDEAIEELQTPGDVLRYVNGRLAVA
jgi:act minimal PKS acyl carrier protein